MSSARGGRAAAALVVLALAAASAAGCSVSDEAPGERAASTEGGSAAFPVEIAHRHGATTIAEEPERIVTVGLTDQDALLAVGVVPIGVTEWFGEQPSATWGWATDELEALGDARPEVVGGGPEIEFEAIADLGPDRPPGR